MDIELRILQYDFRLLIMPEDLFKDIIAEASIHWQFKAHYPTRQGDRLLSQTRVTRTILRRFADSKISLV